MRFCRKYAIKKVMRVKIVNVAFCCFDKLLRECEIVSRIELTRKRTRVNAYTYGNVVRAGRSNHGVHFFVRTDVTRVYTKRSSTARSRFERQAIVKVNIRNNGKWAFCTNLLKAVEIVLCRNRDTNNFASRFHKLGNLSKCRCRITRLGRAHGLDAHRSASADQNISYMYLVC